jgi:heme-degrading monooxygenase HmoA
MSKVCSESKLQLCHNLKGDEPLNENEDATMITRMIFVKVAPGQFKEAIDDWKNVCAPLMISQPGCLSEQLLECRESPDEFISLSNWNSQEAIDAYRSSEAHEQIKHGTRGIKAEVTVKTYNVVG